MASFVPIPNDPPPAYDEATRQGSILPQKTSPTPAVRPHSPNFDQSFRGHSSYQSLVTRPPNQFQTTTVQIVELSNEGFHSPQPVRVTCPNCGKTVLTRVQAQYSPSAYISALCLCFCGLPFCCCIPFLLPDCIDFHHDCPNCNHNFSVYRPY